MIVKVKARKAALNGGAAFVFEDGTMIFCTFSSSPGTSLAQYFTERSKTEIMVTNSRPDQMSTLLDVLNTCKVRNMDNPFKYTQQGLTLESGGKTYQPADLKIIKTYRFEGMSNPDDSSILYIIEASDNTIGYMIDSYGVYSSHDGQQGFDNFIRQIAVEDRDEQLLFSL